MKMAEMTILGFGIIKDIFGSSSVNIQLDDGTNVEVLKRTLEKQYPGLKELGSYMIALNNEYASENNLINTGDELAIIPPVSGG